MEIDRIISWFDKSSEKLIGELDVNHIQLSSLEEIFNPPKNDPMMYNPYNIDIKIGKKIKEIIEIEFNFEKFVYQIDCFQK